MNSQFCSYASLDDAVVCIRCLEMSIKLGKFDIASVYETVSVHPSDHQLLGMMWKVELNVDGVLSLGLRSVTTLFIDISDRFLWISACMG